MNSLSLNYSYLFMTIRPVSYKKFSRISINIQINKDYAWFPVEKTTVVVSITRNVLQLVTML